MGNCFQRNFDAFAYECLAEHNLYRRMHNAPPLMLDKKLCLYAAEWAEYLAGVQMLIHRESPPYGENLYVVSGNEVRGSDPVKLWYNEVNKYDFDTPGFQAGTGNFTQVVWKTSTHLGVGTSFRQGKTFVVVNYDPPGNVKNCFRSNVSSRDVINSYQIL